MKARSFLAVAIPAMLFGSSPSLAADPASPMPKGQPGQWVLSQDYPAAALRERKQGTVRFRLGIAKDGTPSTCEVLESSGSDILDQASCSLLMKRSQFTPARNGRGHPITGTYTSAVRWVLPPHDDLPRKFRARNPFDYRESLQMSDCFDPVLKSGVSSNASNNISGICIQSR